MLRAKFLNAKIIFFHEYKNLKRIISKQLNNINGNNCAKLET